MPGFQKNVANQKWRVFAFNTSTGADVTGDAANITAKIDKDWAGVAATNDTNPTEVEDGYYLFDLTQDETNADVLDLYPESSTSNVQVIGIPATVFTELVATASDETIVPESRTAILRRGGSGLVADNSIGLQVGETAFVAVDFKHDLAERPKAERISSVTSFSLESGSIVTFGTPTKLGSQAKVDITASSAGTATGTCTVVYTDGTTAIGDFTIVVVAA